MPRITVTVDDEHLDVLDDVEQRDDLDSRSAAVREVVEEHERLRQQCEELNTECERLKREKRQVLEQREEHDELVRYVDDEMTRRERRRRAPAWTRAKWWLFGESDEK